MPLEQLADLLRRWQATGGRLDRARVIAEGATLLRELSPTERRALGRAIGDRSVVQVLDRMDSHLPGAVDDAAVDRSVQRLLDLDADRANGVLAGLDAMTPPTPPPPPPPTSDQEPWPEPDPLPHPDPLPEPDPLPSPVPLPEPEPDRPHAPPPPAVSRPETAMHRLRGLDGVAPEVTGTRDALALLRAFPDGWQRRRAADRLLQAGGLDTADAEAVLALFDRQSDRSRVAAGLLMRGLIEIAALHPLVPAGTARRLARRVAGQR